MPYRHLPRTQWSYQILEIRVDRNNEKGVFVAEQILNIIHHSIESVNILGIHKHQKNKVDFTFEIANVHGTIRFFFITPKLYSDFVKSQFFAHYPDIEIIERDEYLPSDNATVGHIHLREPYPYPIKMYTAFKDKSEKEGIDPHSSLTSALLRGKKWEVSLYQVHFSPVIDRYWKDEKKIEKLLSHDLPHWYKHVLVEKGFLLRVSSAILVSMFFAFTRGFWMLFSSPAASDEIKSHRSEWEKGDKDLDLAIKQKLSWFGYYTSLAVVSYENDPIQAKSHIREMVGALNIFNLPDRNGFVLDKIASIPSDRVAKREHFHPWYFCSAEVAGLVHLPTLYVKTPGINWVTSKKFEPPANLPLVEDDDTLTPIGKTNFRGTPKSFGSPLLDRRRHIYIIGKTGMGKSTLLENMIYDDIVKWRGVGLIDPHGDLAETILSSIPKSRTNDVVLFDPTDLNYPIGFNMLESVHKDLQPIVASGLVSVFKRIFGESWWPRLEHILRNTIISLLEVGDETIMSIPVILTHASYRRKIIDKLQDPHLKKFWISEYEAMAPNQMVEAAGPILNKVGQFLSSPLMRNILGQPKNPFSLRWIMDNQKICIINLSKGRIGEDTSALLGAMMVTKFQIDAMTRADILEKDRKDFFLYVDEFQNFATDSFATILSEARKYRLSLVMANQYISQMSEVVQWAVFGNVWSTISFQVGPEDAPKMVEVMGDDEIISAQDLQNLRKYDIYSKLLIDGMPSPVFSATTFWPINDHLTVPKQDAAKIRAISREKYAKPRDFIEKKIHEYGNKVTDDEKKFKQNQEAHKEKIKAQKDEERVKKLAQNNPAVAWDKTPDKPIAK